MNVEPVDLRPSNDTETDPLAQARAFAVQTTTERPFVSVAAAFGVGAILGGGIPNWMVALAVRNGAKAALAYALAPAVTEQGD